jgi:branched-subunit amino acid ABC-type transport system permease component
LFIVPALAAALVGNLKSIGSTVAFGFALGMVQAVMAHVQFQSWYPSWLGPAFASAIPLIALIVILMIRGKRLPIRGSEAQTRLPTAPLVNHRFIYTAVFAVFGSVALLFTDGGYRSATILSLVYVIMALSLTVVTGYVGQISLAQVALAGVAAFFLSRLTADWGVPFPVAPLLAATLSAGLGVLIGIPALRIRGFS